MPLMDVKHQKWWTLIALAVMGGMVTMNQLSPAVVLPTIQRDLGATQLELQWIINSYLVMFAISLLPAGQIGDCIGQRKTFLLGVFLFILSSIFCGLSLNVLELILARGMQGIAIACIAPMANSLLFSLFLPGERGKIMGVGTSINTGFAVMAPLVAGYLTQHANWRWIFWINIPIGIAVIWIVRSLIPPLPPRKTVLDLLGSLLFGVSCFSLIVLIMYPKIAYRIVLWPATLCVICLFLYRERKSPNPCFNISLFRYSLYRISIILVFIAQFAAAVNVYRSLFFQTTLGWSAVKVGMVMTIAAIPLIFLGPINGYIVDRFRYRAPILLSLFLLALSFFWIGFFAHSSVYWLLIGLLMVSIGTSSLMATSSAVYSMEEILPEQMGSAWALLFCSSIFSSSLGVAGIGSLMSYLGSPAQGFIYSHYILSAVLFCAFSFFAFCKINIKK